MSAHVNSTRVKAPTNTIPVISALANDVSDNEEVTSNPQGRVSSDESRKRRNTFLNCKKTTRVSTLNVRTLLPEGKLKELANNFNDNNEEILGIIDHKIVHKENV